MTSIPNYVAAARPVPSGNRAAWFKNAAPTYAGVMLWFVVWQDVVAGDGSPGGILVGGVGTALLALAVAALGCHVLFYLVPGLMGMKSGLPLYVVGTSTFGVRGGLLVPGLLMGVLQFGWMAVNASAVAVLLCHCLRLDAAMPSWTHGSIAAAYVVLAGFMGYKGIDYVAKVASYLPLIPFVVLLLLLFRTIGGLGQFTPEQTAPPATAKVAIDASVKEHVDREAPVANARSSVVWLPSVVMAMAATYVFGFFSQAGAVAVDFGMHNRNTSDIHWGGLVGGSLAILYGCGLATLIVAGAYGAGLVSPANQGSLNPVVLMRDILGEGAANVIMVFLAISSFPAACCAAFVASNCCRTTMPNIRPSLSIGAGVIAAIVLAVSGLAGQIVPIFTVVGAVFGPLVGAMVADYLLAGRKWPGPREGFNPAGWLAVGLGFVVGVADFGFIPGLKGNVPCPPLAAYLVGFATYGLLAKLGLQSRTIRLPATNNDLEKEGN